MKNLGQFGKAAFGALVAALGSLAVIMVGDVGFGDVTQGQWVGIALEALIVGGGVYGIPYVARRQVKLKRPIVIGCKGGDVYGCERGLAKWARPKKMTPDKVYEKADSDLCKEFQHEHLIKPASGKIGQKTLNALWPFMDALRPSSLPAVPRSRG